MFFNGFIDYANEETVAKLENFLHIGLNKSRTLEERRRLVKSYFIGFGKISASLICQMMEAYTNAPVNCRLEPFDAEGNHALYITMQQGAEAALYLSVVQQLISLKIPAHIKYIFAIEVMLDNRNLEQMELQKLLLHTRVYFWNQFYFDGTWKFDGSKLFNASRGRMEVKCNMRMKVDANTEHIGGVMVIVKRNPHFFDGSCKFDGSVMANAVYREEVIE